AGTARWQVFARAGLWVAAAALGRHGLLCADVAASLGQPVPAEMRHRTTTRVVVALVAQDRTSWYPPVACGGRLPCPGRDRRLGWLRRLRTPPGCPGTLSHAGGDAPPARGGGLALLERT